MTRKQAVDTCSLLCSLMGVPGRLMQCGTLQGHNKYALTVPGAQSFIPAIHQATTICQEWGAGSEHYRPINSIQLNSIKQYFMNIYQESDTKLASKDERMSKAQSASPRRLKVMEDGEGLRCVGSIEISQCSNQERRNQRRDPTVFAIREFGPSWRKTFKQYQSGGYKVFNSSNNGR